MWSIRISLVCTVLFWVTFSLKSQPEKQLGDQLRQAGFENIRCVQNNNTIYVAFEDRVDQQPWRGLSRLIEICRNEGIEQPVSVNLETDGIARVNMLYEGGKILDVTANTHPCEEALGKISATSRSYGKLLITALPVLSLRNSRTDVLFTVNAGVAPTLQMELWKGAQVTAQIIFPIYNSMEEQFDHIQPGIISFTQRIKIVGNWQMIGSVGNFTDQRAGAHLQLRYDQPTGWWGIAGDGGITGSSTTWNGEWSFSKWKRIDFQMSAYFYLPVWNTKFEVVGGRFVGGDYGIRGNLSRRFRNVTINLYGMLTDGEINGGFSFIVPLAFTRLKKIHPVSVVWPQWYDWEYSAQSGPEYVDRGLGITYLTRLYERADESYWNPNYIKSQIIYYFNTQK
ncbi:MAG: hypothetical protein RR212_10605 [Bacteroidales bacterium]